MKAYLDDDDKEEDDSPYTSVSDRVDPLADMPNSSAMPDTKGMGDLKGLLTSSIPSGGAVSPAMRQLISNKVLQRVSGTAAPQAGNDDSSDDSDDDSTSSASHADPGSRLANDPLMKDYQSNMDDLKDFQKAKIQADHINNLGQALAQASRGSQTPLHNNELFNSMSDQNQGILKANAEDVDRRQKVMNAIENRNSRLDANQQHSQELALKQKEMNFSRQDRQDERLKDRQNTFTNMLETRLNSSKQLPDVIQAYKDRYASSKLDKLLRQHGGDLDKLSTPQKNMVIAETAKMTSGGAPDDHMMKMLSPESFRGELAKVYQAWTNSPTEAHAGAFLKQYQDYAKDLSDNANQVINDQIGKNLEASRKSIGEDNYKKLKSIYLPDAPPPPKESSRSQGVPGSLVKVKGKLYKIGDDGDSLEEVM